MTLNERKYQNYTFLRCVLSDLETILNQRGFRFYGFEKVKDLMTIPIQDDSELVFHMESCINASPAIIGKTDRGYSIRMISPESKNEEDPIKDVLKLNKIEDIFWAKGIIDKAFLGLFPVREE